MGPSGVSPTNTNLLCIMVFSRSVMMSTASPPVLHLVTDAGSSSTLTLDATAPSVPGPPNDTDDHVVTIVAPNLSVVKTVHGSEVDAQGNTSALIADDGGHMGLLDSPLLSGLPSVPDSTSSVDDTEAVA